MSVFKFKLIGVLSYLLHLHSLFLLQVRLTPVVPCPLGSPLDQALVGVSLCPPLVVDTHPFVLYLNFFPTLITVSCFPFSLLSVIDAVSFSTNAFALIYIYSVFLSSYSQPASYCKILFPMHFYCIQIQHTPMVFLYIQMYSLHLKLQQNIYVHVSLHSKYVIYKYGRSYACITFFIVLIYKRHSNKQKIGLIICSNIFLAHINLESNMPDLHITEICIHKNFKSL